jgi:hypothetical protein
MKKAGMFLAVAVCAAFLVATVVAMPADTKITGWVTDAKCGAKGASASHADCLKKCMDAGEKLVVVSDKDKKVYAVDNQDAVTAHAGHHVTVTGAVTGDSIHVDSVAMVGGMK